MSPIRTSDSVRSEGPQEPSPTVCFCFGHTASDLEADLSHNGRSTIRDAIVAACREGKNDCERANPSGICCLKDVGRVLRAATAELSDQASERDIDDCADACADRAPTPDADGPTRTADSAVGAVGDRGKGRTAVGAAVVAAVLSSTCCWLPLVAVGLGVSASGVAATFQALRIPLLVVTAALLAAAWHFQRRAACAPGDACAAPDPRVRRLTRGVLLLGGVLAVAIALLPQWLAAAGGGAAAEPLAAEAVAVAHYAVAGMTCGGCEGHAREAIEAIPGVRTAAVSYADGTADVAWDIDPDHDAVTAALARLGYEARVATTP